MNMDHSSVDPRQFLDHPLSYVPWVIQRVFTLAADYPIFLAFAAGAVITLIAVTLYINRLDRSIRHHQHQSPPPPPPSSPPAERIPLTPTLPQQLITKETFIGEIMVGIIVPPDVEYTMVREASRCYDSLFPLGKQPPEVYSRIRPMQRDLKTQFAATAHAVEAHYEHHQNTPFKRLLDTSPPVWVPYTLYEPDRFNGMWIVAHPGSGKTNLLNGMILADIKQVAEGKASIMVIDSKTQGTENLLDPWRRVNFAAYDKRLAGRVQIFDPDANLALNFFDFGDEAQVIEIIEYMFSALLDMKTTELQSTLLTKCVLAVKAMPKPSLPALIDFLSRGWQPYEKYVRTLDQLDQAFFLEARQDGKSDFDGRTYRETKDQLRWRLERLLSAVPVLRDTLRSTQTKIDLRKLIDDGNIIIVNAKTGVLRDRGSEFFQRLWTMMLRDAAEKRKRYMPVYCYIDEAQRGIAKDTRLAEILDTCRSSKIAMIISHQGESQIDDKKVLAALGRSAIKLEAGGSQGRFQATIRPSKEPMPLWTVYTDMSALPRLTPDEEVELKDEMRRRYSVDAPPPAPPPSAQAQKAPDSEITLVAEEATVKAEVDDAPIRPSTEW
jgi:hypothetical protein